MVDDPGDLRQSQCLALGIDIRTFERLQRIVGDPALYHRIINNLLEVLNILHGGIVAYGIGQGQIFMKINCEFKGYAFQRLVAGLVPVPEKRNKGVFGADPFAEGLMGGGPLQDLIQELKQEGILGVHQGLLDSRVIHPDTGLLEKAFD